MKIYWIFIVIAIVCTLCSDKIDRADYFNSPEEYEKLGYEGVFAITVRFSQKIVAELDVK